MYRIKTIDKTLYTDAIRYIRLHKNGCYVACEQDKAEGICAKVHENMEEVGTVLRDTVLALSDGAMTGAEPVCKEIEPDIEITTAEMQEGQNAIDVLSILLQAGAITNAQAISFRAIIEQATASLNDETASKCAILFPQLKQDGSLVSVGTRINWKGKIKRAAVDLWDNEQNTPDNAPTLWEDIEYKEGYRIIPASITVGTAFSKDELGWWGESLYKSLIPANVYTPDQYPAGWEVVNK